MIPLAGMVFASAMNSVSIAAERYQIMVMCMLFSSAGLSAAGFLHLSKSRWNPKRDTE
jgi:putative ABC transport system permease protein